MIEVSWKEMRLQQLAGETSHDTIRRITGGASIVCTSDRASCLCAAGWRWYLERLKRRVSISVHRDADGVYLVIPEVAVLVCSLRKKWAVLWLR